VPFSDLPIEELRRRQPTIAEPTDLDAFWKETLSEAREHPLDAVFTAVASGSPLLQSYDVSFAGFGGHRIRGWYHRPVFVDAAEQLPVIVEYLGYTQGRGALQESVGFAVEGFAHFTMDSRGQGWGPRLGATPDPGAGLTPGATPGKQTDGVHDPRAYYYRRLMTDAVRAIEAAAVAPGADANRIAVAGASQGGVLAIAAAALSERVRAASVDVPYLCDVPRGLAAAERGPYLEITDYLARHRVEAETVLSTIAYCDGALLSARAQAPALFSVALRDDTCPPSTVFAAYTQWAGAKDIVVYPHNAHEGGREAHHPIRVAWLREQLGA
jgi:cephalosporin-C deacetylase